MTLISTLSATFIAITCKRKEYIFVSRRGIFTKHSDAFPLISNYSFIRPILCSIHVETFYTCVHIVISPLPITIFIQFLQFRTSRHTPTASHIYARGIISQHKSSQVVTTSAITRFASTITTHTCIFNHIFIVLIIRNIISIFSTRFTPRELATFVLWISCSYIASSPLHTCAKVNPRITTMGTRQYRIVRKCRYPYVGQHYYQHC